MEQQDQKYAIHAAAREGKLTVVESLLNADPKLARKKDDDGRLPLHWAASSNKPEIVTLLSQQKGVKDGEKLVKLLLQRGADANQTNNNGQTALHFVASKNQLDIAHMLFDNKPPASARVRDKRGQYALHRAAAVGSVPIINLLLKNKSPLDATDSSGYTALHHAIAEGHGAAAVALLKAGAETNKRDSDGCVAIDLAPDKEVRKYIEREAENEGIEL
ncbi:ankyrin repeat domain-containing protein [Xylariales sp. PMI_506]|nr:ankyrin repeat domain-containing protein [Xylariales sp. PMI_506]